jgi:hypothetical protein
MPCGNAAMADYAKEKSAILKKLFHINSIDD